MTTHQQSTGRHDNSATALFHRQQTRRHDHWPTRQVTDNFFKNSPTLADTHRGTTRKPTMWLISLNLTQISPGISPVQSESSLCIKWIANDLSYLHADTRAYPRKNMKRAVTMRTLRAKSRSSMYLCRKPKLTTLRQFA